MRRNSLVALLLLFALLLPSAAFAEGYAVYEWSAAGSAMGYRVPLQPSQDGNTVELSTEQTIFAENAVQYRTTLSFLNGRINTLMTALKGE